MILSHGKKQSVMNPSNSKDCVSELTGDAERNRLLAEMAEQSTDMISRHTPDDWRFIYASPAVKVVLGFEVDEIIGMSAYELYHPDDVDDFKRRRPSVIYDQGFYTHTYRFRRKDGCYTWLESTSRTIRDSDTGELREILVVSRDVSHRVDADARMRQYQNELNRASRMAAIGEMASGLAHELNQPLTAIINYARGIERRVASNPELTLDELQLPLARIAATAQRAGDILHRMMDFARKREPKREPLDLSELVTGLIEFCSNMAKQHNVQIESRMPRPLPNVMADRVQIEQVLLNLLLNGIETSQRPADQLCGKVWVEASLYKGKQVMISVCDQGEGIPDNDAEPLFEQFFTTKENGLGMGLPISRSLVEAHGGQLIGENLAEGGAAFRVILPEVVGNNALINNESR